MISDFSNVMQKSAEEYADTAAELVKLRREAKLNGNFFVEPEASRVPSFLF